MKLVDYVPQPENYSSTMKDANLSSLFDAISKAQPSQSGGTWRFPTIGVDQVVNDWVRHQYAYRFQLLRDLYTIAYMVSEIRSPILHIRNEVFRRGMEWEPKFAKKCKECGFESPELVEECPKCKSENLIDPDERQYELFTEFMEDCNVYDQSLREVLMRCHEDLQIADDAFLLLSKEYIELEKLKVRSRVCEIRRLHPALVEFDLDVNRVPKNSHWLCLIHRDKFIGTKPDKCKFCGRELVPAMYVYRPRAGIGGGTSVGSPTVLSSEAGPSVGGTYYLLDSEIIHASKFSPSETYGFSPLLSVIEKALTLIGCDKNLYRYFFERKMPASMLLTTTDDPEGLRREREGILAKMRADPNYLPWIAVSQKTGRGRTELVRLFHTLQEMDYLPVKQEIRERIAALYGVSPLWQMAPEASGGLSTQTQQLVVTSRVVEADQKLFNDKVFPVLMKAFGITDWDLKLLNPEEKAEATRISFAQQKVSAAQVLHGMGFDVKIRPGETPGIEDIDFEVSGEAKKEEAMPMFSEDNVRTWIGGINKAGYVFDKFIRLSSDGRRVIFKSGDKLFEASFNNDGSILRVEKYKQMKIPIAQTLLREPKQETDVFRKVKPDVDEEDTE